MQSVDLNLSIMPIIEAQIIESLRHARPAFWGGRGAGCVSSLHLEPAQVQQAVDRFQRFAPLLQKPVASGCRLCSSGASRVGG